MLWYRKWSYTGIINFFLILFQSFRNMVEDFRRTISFSCFFLLPDIQPMCYPIQPHFCSPNSFEHMAYLDCARCPSRHLSFACNCQEKGQLVVTHEGTSHPSQRTENRRSVCYSCQYKKETPFVFPLLKVCVAMPSRWWKTAENLTIKGPKLCYI